MEGGADRSRDRCAEPYGRSPFVRLPDRLYNRNIRYSDAKRHASFYHVSALCVYIRFHKGDRNMVFPRCPKSDPCVRDALFGTTRITTAKELGVTARTVTSLRALFLKSQTSVSGGASTSENGAAESLESTAEETWSASPSDDDGVPYCDSSDGAGAAIPPTVGSRAAQVFAWKLPTHGASALSLVTCRAATSSRKPIWGLVLLEDVQVCLRAAHLARDADPSDTSGPLQDRFSRLPLSVLQRCIGELEVVRARWCAEVVGPARTAAEDALIELHQSQLNTLAFNVCLWQRRHPLEVVTTGITLFRTHPGLFQRGSLSPLQMLDRLLESVTSVMEPQLARVWPAIRCDVLMTHTHLAPEAQIALMRSTQAAAAGGAHTDCEEEPSKEPLCPKALLHGYLPPEKIPSAATRLSALLTDDQYAELRDAFEVHKRDGALRLLRQQYISPCQS